MEYHGKHGYLTLKITKGGKPLPIAELHKIIRDRLDYCRVTVPQLKDDGGVTFERTPLHELTDIDALAQNAVYEIERALGLHPDTPEKPLGAWTGGVTPFTPTRRWYDVENMRWVDE